MTAMHNQHEWQDPDASSTDSMDDTQSRASQVADRTREQASKAREQASQYGEKAQEAMGRGTERAGSGLTTVGEKIRERTEGQGGTAEQVGSRVAGGLEKAGQYLRDKDSSQMFDDVEEYVRSHPMQGLVGAVVAGFVIGRVLR